MIVERFLKLLSVEELNELISLAGAEIASRERAVPNAEELSLWSRDMIAAIKALRTRTGCKPIEARQMLEQYGR